MESETNEILISKLERGVFRVHLRGRIVRKWKKENFNNKERGDYISLEFLIVDAKGDVIQMTASRALIQDFERKIEEGKCYKISRFQILQNNGYDIATPHICRIKLGTTTTAEEINDENLPYYGLNLVDFDDIIGNNLGGRFFIDVIAEVEYYDLIIEAKNTKRTRLFIEDYNGEHLQFWLWGTHVNAALHIANYPHYKTEKPVVVLQCVHRSFQNGEIRINTTDATKIYVNPNIPEVKEYKTRIPKRPIANRGVVEYRSKDIMSGNLKSLAEILSSVKAGTYVTLAYITEIDETYNWYYNSCNVCKSRAGIKDGLWYCSKEYCTASDIGNPNQAPRFQAKFIIEDGQNQATIKMFENLIQRKIRRSAIECIESLREVGNEHGVPSDFQCFIGKEFVLKIEVHRRFNIEMNSTCYTVYDFSDDQKIVAQWKEKYDKFQKQSNATITIATSTITTEAALSTDMSMERTIELEVMADKNNSDATTPKSKRKTRQSISDSDEDQEGTNNKIEDKASSSKSLKPLLVDRED